MSRENKTTDDLIIKSMFNKMKAIGVIFHSLIIMGVIKIIMTLKFYWV